MNILRHAVDIAGRVTSTREVKPPAEPGKPEAVQGAEVSIVSAPDEFKRKVELRARRFGPQWEYMRERLDRTRTGDDGHYHFLDLPNGDYEIRVRQPRPDSREETVKVVVARKSRVQKPAVAEVVFSDGPIKEPPKPAKSGRKSDKGQRS